ncbi:MAG: NAD(P)-binding domain-containing protein [Burkholderiales bacterium]
MARIAFIGLGVMGYPMAGHLRKKGGHQVTVFNRTPARAAQWVGEYGGASKDLGICLQEAKRNGARLPVTALLDQFYARIQARGGRRWDTSSLIHLLAQD